MTSRPIGDGLARYFQSRQRDESARPNVHGSCTLMYSLRDIGPASTRAGGASCPPFACAGTDEPKVTVRDGCPLTAAGGDS